MTKIEESGKSLSGDYEYHSQGHNESPAKKKGGAHTSLAQMNDSQIVEYGEDENDGQRNPDATANNNCGEEHFSENIDKLKQIRKKRL